MGTIPANTGRILPQTWFHIQDRDHPREYGENVKSMLSQLRAMGPSPRIRGEFFIARTPGLHCRTIPANTGRIMVRRSLATSKADHPREYGENGGVELTDWHLEGPSPRIRGEFMINGGKHLQGGTIPANTGRISCHLRRKPPSTDHPREYGENLNGGLSTYI